MNNKNLKYTDDEVTLVKQRNNVILINRFIAVLMVIFSIIATNLQGWISIPIIILIGWIISIANSVRISNNIQNSIGLSHEEQAVIWKRIKMDYEKSLKKMNNNKD